MRLGVLVMVIFWVLDGTNTFAQTAGKPRLSAEMNKPPAFLAESNKQDSVKNDSANTVLEQSSDASAKTTGLLTDRLSAKDLQKWSAIEQLVFLQTADGQYKHPTLIALWEWVETSGHAVYIEFVPSKAGLSSTAGLFKIEALDPRGECHSAVIQLHLNNIDMAFVGQDMRTAGFVPFENLSREERYAEVLGHEMAHAADILTSLEKSAKVEVLVEQTNAMLLHHRWLNPTEKLTLNLMERLSHRDALLQTLESAAERMEAAVWREISAGKARRSNRANH
jgi:hypothetical protein